MHPCKGQATNGGLTLVARQRGKVANWNVSMGSSLRRYRSQSSKGWMYRVALSGGEMARAD